MQLPVAFLHSLTGIKGFDQEAFEKVHASGEQITSIRINPFKLPTSSQTPSFGGDLGEVVPWTEFGYYLKKRPSFTFDPFFHAGCYYVQEASSMFLEQALKQTVDLSKPLKILDLCAAPGGKSTHIQSLISKDSLLVSNEVIRSRSNILKDNIIKWGTDNVVVTNNDPKDFSNLENYFDVIVVDAPCSGSGLFRREPEAIKEWSLNNVQLCSQRQQRILADVWPSLKKKGILIYCTCSYSKEEDEEICKWIMDNFPIAHCPLQMEKEWGIIETEYGYRFWPDKVKGEGFFIACFKKKEGEEETYFKNKNWFELLSAKESLIIDNWIKSDSYKFIKHADIIYAVPEQHWADINYLSVNLHVLYCGIAIGQLIRDKLLPEHALAMSMQVKDSVPGTELNYETAIEYLKKKDVKVIIANKGWQLVRFGGFNLGWINVLSNRINNYYPKELRILKES